MEDKYNRHVYHVLECFCLHICVADHMCLNCTIKILLDQSCITLETYISSDLIQLYTCQVYALSLSGKEVRHVSTSAKSSSITIKHGNTSNQ